MIEITANVDNSQLKQFGKNLANDLQAVVDKMALMAQATAVNYAPIDTGALRASMYVVTSKTNTGAKAVAAALALNPKSNPYVDAVTASPFESYLFAAVNYADYVEHGAQGKAGSFYFAKTAIELNPVFVDMVRVAVKGATNKIRG